MTVLIPEADPVPSSAKSILRRQARRESTSAPRTITVDNPPAAQGRNPGRSTARRLSLRVRPRRDARPPHRFTSTGRLSSRQTSRGSRPASGASM